MKVIKRDGTIVEYNAEKIRTAIKKANNEVSKKQKATDEEIDEIIKYIDDNYDGNVKLIGGLSLGGQILLDILSKRDNICEYAIIESALVYPMKVTNKLITPSIKISYSLISKKWFSKLQFKSL